MAPCGEIDGAETGEQAQRSAKRRGGQRMEREDGLRRGFDHRRGRNRIGRMRQHRNDSLKQAQRIVRGGLRRALGVGIRGERGQAGEQEPSESHTITSLTFGARASCGTLRR